MDSTPLMDTGAHHDDRIPHLFWGPNKSMSNAMQFFSSILLEKGRMARLRARRVNLICSQAHSTLLLAQERRGQQKELSKEAKWSYMMHAGCAWQQNNQSDMAVSASNSFGVVCNHIYLELHCHCACISTTAYPNLTNSHHPGQALDRFCWQKGL